MGLRAQTGTRNFCVLSLPHPSTREELSTSTKYWYDSDSLNPFPPNPESMAEHLYVQLHISYARNDKAETQPKGQPAEDVTLIALLGHFAQAFRCSEVRSGALSYFVGNDATNDYAGGGGIPEDSGFAIAGGDTWSKVLFFNDQISCVGDVALAQGYYYFTNATSKQDVGVEYTFVYKKIEEGQLKIIVHHSSLPAPVSLPAPASATLTQKGENLNWKKGGKAAWPMKPVWWHGPGHFKPSYGAPSCEERVAAAQEAWKYAILNISEAFRQNALYPNYVQLAADTIDKLYNYDNGKVLFKPTLAAQDPFRDDFIGALSYFVGYEATKEQGGFPEDSGFAIKGGETWSNVTFENNLTNCLGDVALSQGYYYFTAADSGNITGVEYSFVYKQMKTGELKIIAHHSSLPADQV